MNTLINVNRLRAICIGVLTICFASQPCQSAVTVTPKPIELIPPGTQIAKRAPEPWTHLIVKSQPRVTSGDIESVAAVQVKLASKYFMATLAQVALVGEEPNSQHELVRLASGIGTNIDGRDTIISPKTASRLGANVGFRGGILLREMYDEQQSVEVIFRSPTCAIYDTPIALRVGEKNESNVFRYAVVVDLEIGQLNAFGWLVNTDSRGEYLKLSGCLQCLPSDMFIDCRLHVDASEYFLGIPNERAFACLSIPRGEVQLSIDDQVLVKLLAKRRWTITEATSIDALLRKAIKQAALNRANE